MDHDTLRAAIRARIGALGITTGHAARLAGLSDQTARDYLAGRVDTTTARALALARAVGLAVSAAPVGGFRPPPPPPAGKPPKKRAEKG